ncbi:MAG: type I restriction enzyme HsdR N-terminal domain-containing protein [Bacteroidales bacterium]|uniref:type I restriction enzyme HsdR N-terminal domain-containing protein n=1 Tax=Porphyromonas sp. TaxID=1924944 RepID=UPI0029731A22|nr:type I restriction enzyme HsdR N-terminal domain-containing protein [Porphyromonas sp.]MDD7438069.1 type I restriction enzyme HsdR N-terminal domain-containing protein [Bacteroidales bacterium]MDY3067699.1 type I restriction enzyme HsdR N-terminal domain-containing protein [Porphyromonas sp.]
MKSDQRPTVFDPIRQKRVALTPEERVRQALVHFLLTELGYPPARLANEYTITVGKLSRRCDTVVFDEVLRPIMVLEYKASHIPLSQAVIQQAWQYNSALGVPYICLSNGSTTLVYRIGYDGLQTTQLPSIPTYQELCIRHERGSSDESHP